MTYPERGSAEIIERACASTATVLAAVQAADFGRQPSAGSPGFAV